MITEVCNRIFVLISSYKHDRLYTLIFHVLFLKTKSLRYFRSLGLIFDSPSLVELLTLPQRGHKAQPSPLDRLFHGR